MESRDLDWEGCLNVRDLGGLNTIDGTVTRPGAVVRSDHPGYLTTSGWSALWEYGIRTVVSLETASIDPDVDRHNNRRIDYADHQPGLAGVRVDIEDGDDAEFMTSWAKTGLWITPLCFEDALRRWPERHVAAITAVARAQPGGVLIHEVAPKFVELRWRPDVRQAPLMPSSCTTSPTVARTAASISRAARPRHS